MAQGLRNELRHRLETTLQPQQILRSELLQMPLLELEMRIRSEMEENPFIEEIVEEVSPSDNQNDTNDDASVGDNSLTDIEGSDSAIESSNEREQVESEIDWESILHDSDEQWEYRKDQTSSLDDHLETPIPALVTLHDKLIQQLRLDRLSVEEVSIGEELIGNINQDGYLDISVKDIADSTGFSEDMIERVRNRLMRYDPVGVGATSLRECLLVQLEMREEPSQVAISMIRDYWDDFRNKRFETLSSKLGVTLENIKESFVAISKLNPKPGEGYFSEDVNFITPDLVVIREKDDFVVLLNDGDIPSFRINPTYRDMYLNRKDREKVVQEFLKNKLEKARWFINAIHQRRTTMLRTTRAIVARQKEFFLKGPAQLKPMILQDISEMIGMDISTVSRVTNGKYLQCDWGIYELKYFFSEGIATEDGIDVANKVIKEELRNLVANENRKKPLSDQELTILLKDKGYKIERRTVAKYREQLRIPIARLRREV